MIALLIAAALQTIPGDIVVSGQRLDDAYTQCRAGACSTLRDAQVSIAKAEQLLRTGRYHDAKALLAEAVARNRGRATNAPRPVAALYEAYATVAWQEGDHDTFRSAVGEQVRTLRAFLPADDPSVADAGIALADTWTKLGDLASASDVLAATERNARQSGHERIAVSAAIRRAWLAATRGQRVLARSIVATIDRSPLARDPAILPALSVLRMRVALNGKDEGEINRLATSVAGQDVAGAPRLLWSPKLQPTAAQSASAAARWGERDLSRSTSSDVGVIGWVDIGFWIRPNGRTDSIEVLRGTRSTGWARPVIEQINGRRYAELTGSPAGQNGLYRIERYTIRGKYQRPIGSLINRRSGTPSIEMLDLTDGSMKPQPVT